jgi:hypothetical protein
MATALQQLKKELGQAEAQLSELPLAQRIQKIRSAISTLGGASTVRRTRRMSAETRAKLSAAARKRWSGKTKAAKA